MVNIERFATNLFSRYELFFRLNKSIQQDPGLAPWNTEELSSNWESGSIECETVGGLGITSRNVKKI
jgi:hypothetical protein